MTSILVNVLLVLAGCGLIIGGWVVGVWLVVHVIAPQTETEEKPPPPRSAVE